VSVEVREITNYVNPVGTVKGVVLDGKGRPVPQVEVAIYLPRHGFSKKTVTDDQGEIRVREGARWGVRDQGCLG